jgi:DNA mismatch endonuclease (patch repair protein)
MSAPRRLRNTWGRPARRVPDLVLTLSIGPKFPRLKAVTSREIVGDLRSPKKGKQPKPTSLPVARHRKVSSVQRYLTMSSIHSKHTRPEIAVRFAIASRELKYELHANKLPGRPDLILPDHRAAILVHGCFWHQHSRCRLARMPKSRPDYWPEKLRKNRNRDRRSRVALRRLGWKVLTIWECETRDADRLDRKLEALFSKYGIGSGSLSERQQT